MHKCVFVVMQFKQFYMFKIIECFLSFMGISQSSNIQDYADQFYKSKGIPMIYTQNIPLIYYFMKSQLVANIWGPSIVLLAINILPYLYALPVFVQLLSSATLCIHIGSVLSSTLQTASYAQIKKCEQQEAEQSRKLWERIWQILKYPLTATFMLMLLYVAIIRTNEFTLNIFLDLLFVLITSYYGFRWAKTYLSYLAIEITKQWDLSLQMQSILKIIISQVLNIAFWISTTLLYISTKNWLLNNLFSVGFAITSIKQGNFRSFKVALCILWLLFFYDLYWVYESDVMVTVAKSIQLPLKLKFPYYTESNNIQFSILGLGDIILPGLLLSLCLKYDIDCCIHSPNRPKTIQDFKLQLYKMALGAYVLSLISTYSAMHFFKHAQPALVFIVPICSLAVVAGNWLLGRKYSIFKYNTAMLSLKGSPII